MNDVEIANIITKFGYRVVEDPSVSSLWYDPLKEILKSQPNRWFVFLEDPTCVARSLDSFLNFAWIVMSLITAFLLFGWGLALIRNAKVEIVKNIKHLVLLFGSLATVPAILKFLLLEDFNRRIYTETIIPVSEPEIKSDKEPKAGSKLESDIESTESEGLYDIDNLLEPILLSERYVWKDGNKKIESKHYEEPSPLEVPSPSNIATKKIIPAKVFSSCRIIRINIEDIENAMKIPELKKDEEIQLASFNPFEYLESNLMDNGDDIVSSGSGATASVSKFSTSTNGLNLIKKFEGVRGFNKLTQKHTLTKDLCGATSIGYGHLILPGENFSNGLTEQQAFQLLAKDARIAENAVRNNVKVPITQYQFDALVSLTYNIGVGAFKNSKILALINNGNLRALENTWKSSYITSAGVKYQGLVNRRKKEYNLFKSGSY